MRRNRARYARLQVLSTLAVSAHFARWRCNNTLSLGCVDPIGHFLYGDKDSNYAILFERATRLLPQPCRGAPGDPGTRRHGLTRFQRRHPQPPNQSEFFLTPHLACLGMSAAAIWTAWPAFPDASGPLALVSNCSILETVKATCVTWPRL
jgi:hypothetical protein